MTNEQAIELLKRISDSQFDGEYGDERREALEMAVRALESNLVKESGGLVKELVKDCISRQAAIAIVRNRCKRLTTACVLAVTEIEKLPSAQPERKKGKWVWNQYDKPHIGNYHCSVCRNIAIEKYTYCPNCGADMRGESDETICD